MIRPFSRRRKDDDEREERERAMLNRYAGKKSKRSYPLRKKGVAPLERLQKRLSTTNFPCSMKILTAMEEKNRRFDALSL